MPKHQSAQRWAVALFSAAGLAIVFYLATEAGLSALAVEYGSRLMGNMPRIEIKLVSFGIAGVVGAEVLLWVLRLPERRQVGSSSGLKLPTIKNPGTFMKMPGIESQRGLLTLGSRAWGLAVAGIGNFVHPGHRNGWLSGRRATRG